LASIQSLATAGVDVHIVGVGQLLDAALLNEWAHAGGKPRPADSSGAYFWRAASASQVSWAIESAVDIAIGEQCDGIDNDCDGLTDEGIPKRACNAACGGGTQSCVGGAYTACSLDPQEELCNGIDDDCDGQIDNDWASGLRGQPLAAACSVGVGGCERTGVHVCDPFDPFGPTICSESPGDGTSELCNSVDDDCDGQTDENLSKLCNTACGGGLQLCVGGIYGPCSIAGAAEELCNDADDDCDGITDENAAGTPLERPCAAGCSSGTEKCFNGTWLACSAGTPAEESCNSVDDDCDGLTDEGADGAPLIEVCTGVIVDPGALGVCKEAARVCGAVVAGQFGPCGTAATPSAEKCNGLDDDCDGVTDENALGAPLTEPCFNAPGAVGGVGECAAGQKTCNSGAWSACSGQSGPGDETCDGLDNDCDGQTDENAGAICATKPGCHTGLCKCAKLPNNTYGCFLD
jgi:hypothetical protein